MSNGGMSMTSPMSQWTTINNMINTPSSAHSGLPELGSSFSPSVSASSLLSTPENSHAHILQKGFSSSPAAGSSYSPSPMSQHSLPPILPLLQSMPQNSPHSYGNHQNMHMISSPTQSQTLPQPCGFAFATPTFAQDQSVYQSQLAQQQQQYQQQQQQVQSQQQSQQTPTSANMQGGLQHAAYAISPPINTPDLSFPTELFFDNLCM